MSNKTPVPKQLSNLSLPRMKNMSIDKKPSAVTEKAPDIISTSSDNGTPEIILTAAPAAPNVASKPIVTEYKSKLNSAPKVINTGTRDVNTIPVASATKPKVGIASVNTGSRMASMVSNLTKDNVVAKKPEQVVGDLLDSVPPAYRYPLTRIYDYIERMDPSKRENEEMGSGEQVALYRSIVNIIDGKEEYFQPMFTALLRLFNTYNGPRQVFHDYNCSRYMQVVTLNTDERKAFNNLICFLKLMANPENRHVVARTTDHTRLLAYGLTDTGRNRVVSFLDL